mmetsp:Transcript_43085/g.111644  ORF Transcript_43085/g.111644 Transcript_43085/m.111644 type:complete len:287 (+) Transcript_43085:143-1003(+)
MERKLYARSHNVDWEGLQWGKAYASDTASVSDSDSDNDEAGVGEDRGKKGGASTGASEETEGGTDSCKTLDDGGKTRKNDRGGAATSSTVEEQSGDSKHMVAKWKKELDERMKKISKRIIEPLVIRGYCKQVLSKEFDELVATMLKTLLGFQQRLRASEPMKAKLRRRLVFGLREVLRGTKLGHVKMLILTPNIEDSEGDRSTGDFLSKILLEAERHNTPCYFALSRRRMARVLHWKAHVSCVAVYSADGANEEFKKIKEMGDKLRREYEERNEGGRHGIIECPPE